MACKGMHYFAYGSNLCAIDLSRWCRERALNPLALAAHGPAFLPDRRLAFTHRSATRGGGVLDIPQAKGQAVAGVLFSVPDDATIAVLDRKEGEGHAYRRIETVALTEDGADVPAYTYEVVAESREPYVVPAPSYLDVVRRGYAAFGLSQDPLDAAARGATHPGPILWLFVYGTLRRGGTRHPTLPRHGARGGEMATAAGSLLDLGPYPGLIVDGPKAQVAGELYSISDPGMLITEIDAIETFRGYGVTGSLYRRAIVRAKRADGAFVLAWTYVYSGPRGAGCVVSSGDWHDRPRP